MHNLLGTPMKRLLFGLLALFSAAAMAAAGDYVDRSGTVTLGGTSQTLAAADETRGTIIIANPSTETETLCVNVTSAASCSTPGSWLISPGGALTLNSKELVTVTATTTGHKFTAKERAIGAFLNNPGTSSGGGGAGDASAANQTTQITAEQAIQATVGATGDAAATQGSTGSLSAKLRTITSQLNNLTTVTSPKAPGAATATSAQQTGCTYNSAGVTLTDTQEAGCQFDANGRIRVVGPDSLALTGTATSATTLFTQDLTGYEAVGLQVTSAGSATISYEQSEDQTTWFLVPGFATTTTSGAAFAMATSSTSATTYVFPRRHRYFRARVSSYTSGTVTVVGHAFKANLTTLAYVGASVVGAQANSAARSGNPVSVSGRVRTTNDATLVADDAADMTQTTSGALTAKPYSIPEVDWSYAAAASGISNTTTAVTIKAADGSLRNYLTRLDIMCEALGTATEVAIRDGAGGTVLWRTKVGTGGLTTGWHLTFPNPLRGTAATLLEVVTLTASGTGACYVNSGGYVAP